jgi:hypothetical protein
MKKHSLLIFSCILAAIVAGCDDDGTPSFTSEDEGLAGETVTAGDENAHHAKLFVLNEGSYGQNNASLDFFRYSDGMYVRNSFSQMNPSLSSGLGDVGNDIRIHGSEAWIAVNNSGLIEVISAINEKHIATISVPMPRSIAFDDTYAYVTSWSGAYYGGPERKGAVYRINISNKTFKDSVSVGCQPEGLTINDGKLYVANSGGVNSAGYENTVSVIDASSFTAVDEISLPTQMNLKDITADGEGNLWVTSFGNYYSVHSGLAKIDPATKDVTEYDNVRIGSCLWNDSGNGSLYVIGTEDEWSWDPGIKKTYSLYTIATPSGSVSRKALGSSIAYPYSVAVDSYSGDIFIGDAADAKSPGTVWCLDSTLTQKWKATAGLFPGHFAFWQE